MFTVQKVIFEFDKKADSYRNLINISIYAIAKLAKLVLHLSLLCMNGLSFEIKST